MKSSATTGQPSLMPYWSASVSMSAGVVTGVMRSTMVLGKGTWAWIHAPSAGSSALASDSTHRLATWPFSGMLSHDITCVCAQSRETPGLAAAWGLRAEKEEPLARDGSFQN